MSTGSELGFDLDEEVVELFDAILLNITRDKELNEEFKKLKFIKTLQSKYDGSKGPIKQMLEKLAKIEKETLEMRLEFVKTKVDCRRAVEDLTFVCHTIREAAKTEDKNVRYNALKKLEGVEQRKSQYSWNHK